MPYSESDDTIYGLAVAISNDADGDGVFSDMEPLRLHRGGSAIAVTSEEEEEESWVELQVSIYSKGK